MAVAPAEAYDGSFNEQGLAGADGNQFENGSQGSMEADDILDALGGPAQDDPESDIEDQATEEELAYSHPEEIEVRDFRMRRSVSRG